MSLSFFHKFLSRRYLRHMICVAIVLVMIPCIIGFAAIYRISYQEIIHSNEGYYHQTLNNFSSLFSARVSQIAQHAWQISEDSRNPQRPAYAMQRQALTGDPINYRYPFISTLNQYRYSSPVSDFGLYYPEHDILFFDSFKYDAASFLRDQGLDEQTADYPSMQDFLKQNHQQSVRFHAAANKNGVSKLYVGVQTTMGTNRDRALFIYIMDSSALELSSILSESTFDAQFFLLDEEQTRVMFTSGKNHLFGENLLSLFQNEKNSAYQSNGKTYSVYFSQEQKYGFTCAAVIPFDTVSQNLVLFSRMVTLVMIAAVLLLIVLLSLLIYISYRPINRTLQLIGPDEPPNDEWQIIDDTLIQMRSEILEKNQIILDHLLNNLLYGMEISSADAARLGLNIRNEKFRVFTWRNQFLATEERAELVTALKNQMETVAYITDILGHDHSVIICQIKEHHADHLTEWLRCWFSDHFPAAQDFQAGIIADSLNKIHDSYVSCFPASSRILEDENDGEQAACLTPETDERKHASQLQKMQKDVEAYIQEHFHDPTISQITVADCFGISVYSLSRLFNNHIGVSFTKYITNLRLEEARHMLVQTDMTISEISCQVGMPNTNYFSRLFKQNYATSPIQYRNKARENESKR